MAHAPLSRDMLSQRITRLAATLVVSLAFALAAGCDSGSAGDDGGPMNPVAPTTASGADPSTPPSNLVAPIDPSAISLDGVINPFGVVRSSLDDGTVGHPGIDLPSSAGTSMLAVAAGRIVTMEPATDGLPGQVVRLLIAEGADAGTGWVFFYEHIAPAPGIGVGTNVSQGQAFATSPLSSSFGNHLELAWVFNSFRFHSNQTCWVTQLGAGAQAGFQNHFDNVLRTDQRFINGWTTVTFEGRLPFRALLDPAQFPNGARPCYPPGTDVRADP